MKFISLIAGPVVATGIYFVASANGLDAALCKMAFITIWVAVWWMTEPIDVGVTSLLPFVLMPLLGIMPAAGVAMQYMNETIFLFIGGFILAYAMEKWNLHHRIAFRIIMLTGNSPTRILAGIMLTAYTISMWISNTAAALMLIGAVTAIVKNKELFKSGEIKNIATAYMIALAYSATIGGMATLVGTPTNILLAGYWKTNFSEMAPITFIRWSLFGIPFSLVLLVIVFILLKIMFIKKDSVPQDKSFIKNQYAALGKISFEQKIVVVIFFTTCILWLTRAGFDFGSFQIRGWGGLFGEGFVLDSTIAILIPIILFVIPSKNKKESFVLGWVDVKKIPLNIILLFGGGFALAKGIEVSGLSNFIANQLQFLKNYPLWVTILIIVITVTILSEVTSNVASIILIMPILGSLAKALNVDPLLLLIPAGFAASFGFMLHVATPPNTIAYASGYVQTRQMLRIGLVINITAIILVTIAILLFGF